MPLLNDHQVLAYNMIMHSVKKVKEFNDLLHVGINAVYPNIQNFYFIGGLGEAGETFLYNTVLCSMSRT